MSEDTITIPVSQVDGVTRVDFDYTRARTEDESNAQWRFLRENAPVAWSEHHGGHWVLSGNAEVSDALQDWETFSSTRNEPNITPMIIARTPMGQNIPQELDPPEGRPYRRLFVKMIDQAMDADRIQMWVNYYLDRMIESGSMDLTADFASPATGAVVLDWLGWPREEWDRISRAYHFAVGYTTGMPEFEQAVEDLAWLSKRLGEEVASRRANPRDDAMTAFALAEVDGQIVSEAYAQSMVRLAIAGGVETTVSATTAALVHLHFNEADRQALVNDPELFDKAIEEFLRVYPPVRSHGRTVRRVAEVGGQTLKPGDRVLIGQASANRDEQAFPGADSFQIDRSPNRHLSFGHGIHRCPGAALGRLEMKTMIATILKRIPDYRVVEGELQGYPSWGITGGWAKVPVEFTPGVKLGDAAQ